MGQAIASAIENVRAGGGPFGAVVVKDGRVIGAGVNSVTQTNDPTAHAEVLAIRAACAALGSFELTECDLYTSCEPCPMCLGAIYWARLNTVYFGGRASDAAAAGFDDAFIYQEIPKGPRERAIPFVPLMREDALAASPFDLKLEAEQPLDRPDRVRQVSLNEVDSEKICVTQDAAGNVVQVRGTSAQGCPADSARFGPREALLGVVDTSDPNNPRGIPLEFTDTTGISRPVPVTLRPGVVVHVNVTENPRLGNTEQWEIYNFTSDAHPIHVHLVRFQVVGRRAIHGGPSVVGDAPQPTETGFKDTVFAYPGEITAIKALFDLPGLYVWHCHILEHEDHEMMRPFVVSP